MECLKGERGTLRPAVIFAEFIDLQLAQRVIKVSRIVSAATRFLVGIRGFLERFFPEIFCAVRDGPTCGVKLDANDITSVAQEGFLELSQSDLGIAFAKTLLHDHR